MDKEDLKPVTVALGLSENASVDEMVKAINRSILPNNPQDKTEQALQSGILEAYGCDELIKMASSNRTAFNAYPENGQIKSCRKGKKRDLN